MWNFITTLLNYAGFRYNEAVTRGITVVSGIIILCWLCNIAEIYWISILLGTVFTVQITRMTFDPRVLGPLAIIGIFLGAKNDFETIEDDLGKIIGTYAEKMTMVNAICCLAFATLGVIPFASFPLGFWYGLFGSLMLANILWKRMGRIIRMICVGTGIALLVIGFGSIVFKSNLLPGFGISASMPASWETNKANVAMEESQNKQVDYYRSLLIKKIDRELAAQNTAIFAGKPVPRISPDEVDHYNDLMKEIGSRNRLILGPTKKNYIIMTEAPASVTTLFKKGGEIF